MKQLSDFRPGFDPATKTLDFSSKPGGFQINKLYSVLNVTQNTPIYIMGASGYGYTTLTDGNVLTLAFDTTSHAATDVLNVVYDESVGAISNTPQERGGVLQSQQESLDQILVELKTMNLILAQGLNINFDDVQEIRNDINNPVNSN